MGVYANHIIRHDFHDLNNVKAAKAFVEETAQTIAWAFGHPCKYNIYREDYDENFYSTPLDQPNSQGQNPVFCFEVELECYYAGPWRFALRNGFWQIEGAYNYGQLFQDDNVSDYPIRDVVYRFCRVLKQKECWHTHENMMENSEFAERLETATFEEWYEWATQNYLRVPEFTRRRAFDINYRDSSFEEMPPVLHDSFGDCHNFWLMERSRIYNEIALAPPTKPQRVHFYFDEIEAGWIDMRVEVETSKGVRSSKVTISEVTSPFKPWVQWLSKIKNGKPAFLRDDVDCNPERALLWYYEPMEFLAGWPEKILEREDYSTLNGIFMLYDRNVDRVVAYAYCNTHNFVKSLYKEIRSFTKKMKEDQVSEDDWGDETENTFSDELEKI